MKMIFFLSIILNKTINNFRSFYTNLSKEFSIKDFIYLVIIILTRIFVVVFCLFNNLLILYKFIEKFYPQIFIQYKELLVYFYTIILFFSLINNIKNVIYFLSLLILDIKILLNMIIHFIKKKYICIKYNAFIVIEIIIRFKSYLVKLLYLVILILILLLLFIINFVFIWRVLSVLSSIKLLLNNNIKIDDRIIVNRYYALLNLLILELSINFIQGMLDLSMLFILIYNFVFYMCSLLKNCLLLNHRNTILSNTNLALKIKTNKANNFIHKYLNKNKEIILAGFYLSIIKVIYNILKNFSIYNFYYVYINGFMNNCKKSKDKNNFTNNKYFAIIDNYDKLESSQNCLNLYNYIKYLLNLIIIQIIMLFTITIDLLVYIIVKSQFLLNISKYLLINNIFLDSFDNCINYFINKNNNYNKIYNNYYDLSYNKIILFKLYTNKRLKSNYRLIIIIFKLFLSSLYCNLMMIIIIAMSIFIPWRLKILFDYIKEKLDYKLYYLNINDSQHIDLYKLLNIKYYLIDYDVTLLFSSILSILINDYLFGFKLILIHTLSYRGIIYWQDVFESNLNNSIYNIAIESNSLNSKNLNNIKYSNNENYTLSSKRRSQSDINNTRGSIKYYKNLINYNKRCLDSFNFYKNNSDTSYLTSIKDIVLNINTCFKVPQQFCINKHKIKILNKHFNHLFNKKEILLSLFIFFYSIIFFWNCFKLKIVYIEKNFKNKINALIKLYTEGIINMIYFILTIILIFSIIYSYDTILLIYYSIKRKFSKVSLYNLYYAKDYPGEIKILFIKFLKFILALILLIFNIALIVRIPQLIKRLKSTLNSKFYSDLYLFKNLVKYHIYKDLSYTSTTDITNKVFNKIKKKFKKNYKIKSDYNLSSSCDSSNNNSPVSSRSFNYSKKHSYNNDNKSLSIFKYNKNKIYNLDINSNTSSHSFNSYDEIKIYNRNTSAYYKKKNSFLDSINNKNSNISNYNLPFNNNFKRTRRITNFSKENESPKNKNNILQNSSYCNFNSLNILNKKNSCSNLKEMSFKYLKNINIDNNYKTPKRFKSNYNKSNTIINSATTTKMNKLSLFNFIKNKTKKANKDNYMLIIDKYITKNDLIRISTYLKPNDIENLSLTCIKMYLVMSVNNIWIFQYENIIKKKLLKHKRDDLIIAMDISSIQSYKAKCKKLIPYIKNPEKELNDEERDEIISFSNIVFEETIETFILFPQILLLNLKFISYIIDKIKILVFYFYIYFVECDMYFYKKTFIINDENSNKNISNSNFSKDRLIYKVLNNEKLYYYNIKEGVKIQINKEVQLDNTLNNYSKNIKCKLNKNLTLISQNMYDYQTFIPIESNTFDIRMYTRILIFDELLIHLNRFYNLIKHDHKVLNLQIIGLIGLIECIILILNSILHFSFKFIIYVTEYIIGYINNITQPNISNEVKEYICKLNIKYNINNSFIKHTLNYKKFKKIVLNKIENNLYLIDKHCVKRSLSYDYYLHYIKDSKINKSKKDNKKVKINNINLIDSCYSKSDDSSSETNNFLKKSEKKLIKRNNSINKNINSNIKLNNYSLKKKLTLTSNFSIICQVFLSFIYFFIIIILIISPFLISVLKDIDLIKDILKNDISSDIDFNKIDDIERLYSRYSLNNKPLNKFSNFCFNVDFNIINPVKLSSFKLFNNKKDNTNINESYMYFWDLINNQVLYYYNMLKSFYEFAFSSKLLQLIILYFNKKDIHSLIFTVVSLIISYSINITILFRLTEIFGFYYNIIVFDLVTSYFKPSFDLLFSINFNYLAQIIFPVLLFPQTHIWLRLIKSYKYSLKYHLNVLLLIIVAFHPIMFIFIIKKSIIRLIFVIMYLIWNLLISLKIMFS